MRARGWLWPSSTRARHGFSQGGHVCKLLLGQAALLGKGDAHHAHHLVCMVNGKRHRCLRLDGLCPGAHVTAAIRLEIARGHGLIALPGEASHALTEWDLTDHLENLGRNIVTSCQ